MIKLQLVCVCDIHLHINICIYIILQSCKEMNYVFTFASLCRPVIRFVIIYEIEVTPPWFWGYSRGFTIPTRSSYITFISTIKAVFKVQLDVSFGCYFSINLYKPFSFTPIFKLPQFSLGHVVLRFKKNSINLVIPFNYWQWFLRPSGWHKWKMNE